MNPCSEAFRLAQTCADVLVTQGSDAATQTMVSAEIWADLPYWGKIAVKDTIIMLAQEKGWKNG